VRCRRVNRASHTYILPRPRPPTGRSAALMAVRLPASAAERVAASNFGSSGSGAHVGEEMVAVFRIVRSRSMWPSGWIDERHAAQPSSVTATKCSCSLGVASTSGARSCGRHAEMDQQAVAAVQSHEEIFSPPAKTCHRAPVSRVARSMGSFSGNPPGGLRHALARGLQPGSEARMTVSTSGSSGLLRLSV